MEDPRIIFKQELLKIGILSEDAFNIALEAGSSQIVVNRKYFENLQYSENIKKLALDLANKFYSGELFEELEQ